eukprot:TRINITY_DN677_c1_g1_i3.p1 TRINITY_DN677_c1_g1~~TRINITY_DN677_c1_g1_i3.p1  ORF type:complete len:1126 (+),score=238.37 TRINITY_DN677_c1_g1_i3:153-3530(+)
MSLSVFTRLHNEELNQFRSCLEVSQHPICCISLRQIRDPSQRHPLTDLVRTKLHTFFPDLIIGSGPSFYICSRWLSRLNKVETGNDSVKFLETWWTEYNATHIPPHTNDSSTELIDNQDEDMEGVDFSTRFSTGEVPVFYTGGDGGIKGTSLSHIPTKEEEKRKCSKKRSLVGVEREYNKKRARVDGIVVGTIDDVKNQILVLLDEEKNPINVLAELIDFCRERRSCLSCWDDDSLSEKHMQILRFYIFTAGEILENVSNVLWGLKEKDMTTREIVIKVMDMLNLARESAKVIVEVCDEMEKIGTHDSNSTSISSDSTTSIPSDSTTSIPSDSTTSKPRERDFTIDVGTHATFDLRILKEQLENNMSCPKCNKPVKAKIHRHKYNCAPAFDFCCEDPECNGHRFIDCVGKKKPVSGEYVFGHKVDEGKHSQDVLMEPNLKAAAAIMTGMTYPKFRDYHGCTGEKVISRDLYFKLKNSFYDVMCDILRDLLKFNREFCIGFDGEKICVFDGFWFHIKSSRLGTSNLVDFNTGLLIATEHRSHTGDTFRGIKELRKIPVFQGSSKRMESDSLVLILHDQEVAKYLETTDILVLDGDLKDAKVIEKDPRFEAKRCPNHFFRQFDKKLEAVVEKNKNSCDCPMTTPKDLRTRHKNHKLPGIAECHSAKTFMLNCLRLPMQEGEKEGVYIDRVRHAMMSNLDHMRGNHDNCDDACCELKSESREVQEKAACLSCKSCIARIEKFYTETITPQLPKFYHNGILVHTNAVEMLGSLALHYRTKNQMLGPRSYIALTNMGLCKQQELRFRSLNIKMKEIKKVVPGIPDQDREYYSLEADVFGRMGYAISTFTNDMFQNNLKHRSEESARACTVSSKTARRASKNKRFFNTQRLTRFGNDKLVPKYILQYPEANPEDFENFYHKNKEEFDSQGFTKEDVADRDVRLRTIQTMKETCIAEITPSLTHVGPKGYGGHCLCKPSVKCARSPCPCYISGIACTGACTCSKKCEEYHKDHAFIPHQSPATKTKNICEDITEPLCNNESSKGWKYFLRTSISDCEKANWCNQTEGAIMNDYCSGCSGTSIENLVYCDRCNLVWHKHCLVPPMVTDDDFSSETHMFACCEECTLELKGFLK